MSSQVVRLRNGESIVVRTGVLRGAGPMGPLGPRGVIGPAGPIGVKGDPGQVSDKALHLSSSSSISVSFDQWYDAPLEDIVEDVGVLKTPRPDVYSFSVIESGRYLVTMEITFAKPAANASGSRRVRLVDQAGIPMILEAVDAALNEDTVVNVSYLVKLDPGRSYKLQLQARDASAVASTMRRIALERVGSGPQGIAGPLGPAGQTGPAGQVGAPGSSGTGYASFNALAGVADTELNPGGVQDLSTDQGLPTPDGTQKPYLPYFLRQLVLGIESRVVARYASAADRNTRRPTLVAGQVFVLQDTGVPYIVDKDLSLKVLARVVVTTSVPPTGAGAGTPGTIWAQV